MIVADSSAVVDYLTDAGPRGQAAAARFAQVSILAAPHLLDVEVASALLGMARGTRDGVPKLSQSALTQAIADYRSLPIRRYEHLDFFERVRKLHANLSAYDAHYVALAEELGVPLLTSDARIGKSGAAQCAVETI